MGEIKIIFSHPLRSSTQSTQRKILTKIFFQVFKLWKISRRKLDQLNAAVSLGALRIPPGNKLESLKGDRQGQHSIRINEQFRVCFIWTDEGPERVEITDYH